MRAGEGRQGKKKWLGEKNLPGRGENLSVPTPSPRFHTCLMHFNQPLRFSLSKVSSASCFPLAWSTFLSLSHSSCPGGRRGARKKRNTVPLEGSAIEGSGERFPGREVPDAKEVSEYGH